MDKIYMGRATTKSKKLMAQLQFQGEDLERLSAKDIQFLLGKHTGKPDITGASGQLVNVANNQIRMLNSKYETTFENFKIPRRGKYTSEGTWKVALQETYMKVQNFLLSPESGKSYYEDDIAGLVQSLEKTIQERKEQGKTYREREKKYYYDEEGKKHQRSEYIDYNEGEPKESVYESSKDFYRLVNELVENVKRLGIQATKSDIEVAAKETIQEHPIISPKYTFNDLCKDALNKLKNITNTEYRKGVDRFGGI